MESEMLREKIQQSATIMEELDVDAWLVFVRETETLHDPSVDVVVGCNVTWQSAFIYLDRQEARHRRELGHGSGDTHRLV